MSPGNVSPSSFSVQHFPGDMSPGKGIPSDKSPGIPLICDEDDSDTEEEVKEEEAIGKQEVAPPVSNQVEATP
ncbi:hypothetical protein Tco_0905414 [Tanacetum coccineum]